jgi:alpha-tubulin suppressor-like RCC1 family protein
VACGDTHTLVVLQGGELYSFGRNQNGQLGLGTTEDALCPQLVAAMQVGQAGGQAPCLHAWPALVLRCGAARWGAGSVAWPWLAGRR